GGAGWGRRDEPLSHRRAAADHPRVARGHDCRWQTRERRDFETPLAYADYLVKPRQVRDPPPERLVAQRCPHLERERAWLLKLDPSRPGPVSVNAPGPVELVMRRTWVGPL